MSHVSTCICTRCAVEEQPIVVGGRYVVGENPTYRAGLGSVEELGDAAGLSVVVTDRASSDGDVFVGQVDGNDAFWIDPRHLTPAPEPAAAPAVDDDLLADLGKVVDELHYQGNSSWEADGRGLLQSKPMVRLFSIWTATVAAQRDQYADAWEAAVRELVEARAQIADLVKAGLDLDVLREELEVTRQDLERAKVQLRANQAYMTGQDLDINGLTAQRDEARATKDLHKERQQELEAALNAAEDGWDEARVALDLSLTDRYELRGKVRRLTAEVESLRAAQQLPNCGHPNHGSAEHRCEPFLTQFPDVGPVTRDDGELMFPDGSHWHPASLDWREQTALDVLARVRAARAFLDAEAADTSSDDEAARHCREQGGCTLHPVPHRARGGQEAGQ